MFYEKRVEDNYFYKIQIKIMITFFHDKRVTVKLFTHFTQKKSLWVYLKHEINS